MLNSVLAVLDKINVPSTDDGTRFVTTDRVDAIRTLLAESQYRELKGGGLSFVYAHPDFDASEKLILISCHADALYHRYFVSEMGDGELIGTFDNSITNAVLVELMRQGAFHPGVIVAFTGDEEHELRGADETAEFLTETLGLEERLALVIVLDVTAEGYGEHDFTLENLFIREDEESVLHFADRQQFEVYLRACVGNEPLVIPDAVTDEAWEYDEWDLNCFSLCLPTKPVEKNRDAENWMHSDDGIVLTKQAVAGYAQALRLVCERIVSLPFRL